MNKKRRVLLLAGLLAVLAITGIGGSLAWLSNAEQANNTFTVGLVNIGIVENGGLTPIEGGSKDFVPITSTGQTVTKDVQIKNLDTPAGRAVPACIRARVVPTWRYADDSSAAVPVTLVLADTSTNWILKDDGYYYYKLPVAPGNLTESLMKNVTVNSAVPTGAHLEIQVIADAVQAEGGAALDAWGFNPTI